MKNCRVHPTHWLISTQVVARDTREMLGGFSEHAERLGVRVELVPPIILQEPYGRVARLSASSSISDWDWELYLPMDARVARRSEININETPSARRGVLTPDKIDS